MAVFTLEEVKKHNTRNDLWMVIGDKVYDVTDFLSDHPGGEEILLEQAGLDATAAFEDVGHSESAHELLKQFYIGDLANLQPVATSCDESAREECPAKPATSCCNGKPCKPVEQGSSFFSSPTAKVSAIAGAVVVSVAVIFHMLRN